jgi:Beta protein
MRNVNFEDYSYFPTLRTRQSEMKGLAQLDAARKSKILPLLTLGRWPKATDFDKAAEKAEAVMDKLPHFLDLTTDATHLGDQQKILRNPENAFLAWRNFVGQYASAIPVVQLVPDAKVRDVFKQAQAFEKIQGKLAFRIKDFLVDTPLVINAISAMDDPANAIVFIDCQYIRDALTAYVTATVATVNQLRSEFPDLMVVVLSTSFPSSVLPFADTSQSRGSIDMLERQLHARIGGDAVAAYGDHASIHSVVYDDVPIMRWSARIDYPSNFLWSFERRPGDQTSNGFISAAKSIVATDSAIGTRDIWGEQMILDAANGNPHAKAPAPWISVRVNIHLSRQIDLSALMASGIELADGDEFEE